MKPGREPKSYIILLLAVNGISITYFINNDSQLVSKRFLKR